MYLLRRFPVGFINLSLVLLSLVLFTACNPVPLSVEASDFSINGVKGTSATSTTSTSGASTTTTTGTKTATTSTATGTNTGLTTSTTASTTPSVTQAVTIDLTSKETCSNLSSLVAKVTLDEGVKISPDPAVARDYTSPVSYTVTEVYGAKVVYTVTVKGKDCNPTKTTNPANPISPRTDCTIDAIGKTGYSLVFKECDANKVAQYYDETECVRDNETNLIWEGKTASGLRAGDEKYNNLDNTSLLQIAANTVPGTTASPARSPTQAEIDAPDNSIGYKNTVNSLNVCGSNRWRMPTKVELQTLLLTSATTKIDLTWFPNTNLKGYYATSTPFGTQEERSSVVQFGDGTVDNLLRDGTVWDPVRGALPLREHSVRLVRSAF
jgi:Protein of unknown function (DUF1566)